MSVSNKDRAESALSRLDAAAREWLAPRLERAYGDDWRKVVASDVPADCTVERPCGLLAVWAARWNDLTGDDLSAADRRNVAALAALAQESAGADKLSSDAAERALQDAEHMARVLGAASVADELEDARRDLRQVRFEDDQRRLQRAAQRDLAVRFDTGVLPAWRTVVEPHDDVAKGTFQLAQFAADLRLVHQGKASPEYGDPVAFFERTYLTRGLHDLLKTAARRMNGAGGDPVVDLMTTFGGGKTHSLLAVYHMCSGVSPDALDGVREVCDEAGVTGLPRRVNRAVIVGNDMSVLGKDHGDLHVNTMWGELAWQLGGSDGYALVADHDRRSVPPDTTILEGLIERFSPCVILVDEWVAYLRQLWSASPDDAPLPAGKFDGHLTFVQSLTESLKNVPRALMVVSLPSSDSVRDMGAGIVDNAHEIGGTPGLEALRGLRSVIHRLETPWQQATPEESYEIVRRRLFKPFGREQLAARDLVVARFKDHYKTYMADVPTDVREWRYEQTLKNAYPIHPELFERLYEDWSTLERFQRTRGVLRLMATVVHALWTRGDTGAVILPASVPLDDQKVVEELASHLDDKWAPVIDTDLAGTGSTAAGVDRDIPLLGRSMAGQRAARALFLGSAPTANRRDKDGREVVNRGIEQKRVVLGSTYPGDNPAHVADALRQIAERGTYVNRDADRYSLSLSQNLAQLARSRADGYHDDEILDTLTDVLREEKDRGVFARVHRMPASSSDVDDEPTAALVVFGPDRPYRKPKQGQPESPAEQAIREFLQKRGGVPRIHKNALVFAAPDADRCETLLKAVRAWKSWKSVVDGAADLNLAPAALTNARARLDQANQTMRGAIKEAYRWVLNPAQEPGSPDITLDAIFMNGQGTIAERVTRKADESELVYRTYTVSFLRRWIDQLHLWGERPHVEVGRLAGYFTDYVYMPRLLNTEVVFDTIRRRPDSTLAFDSGVAYADYVDDAGRYHGVSTDTTHHVSATGLIVDPTVIAGQQRSDREAAERAEAERAARAGDGTQPSDNTPTPAPDDGTTRDPEPEPVEPTPTGPTRLFASRDLDPVRMIRDVSNIHDELVQHFTAAGVPVTVHLEIASEHLAELDPAVVVALRENLRQLGFDGRPE